jgi:hypothetical protein
MEQITDPVTGVIRCPVANSIQIHIRMEQIYEITGQASLKTMDTLLTANQAVGIDMQDIINSKYGATCPPGTHMEASICKY